MTRINMIAITALLALVAATGCDKYPNAKKTPSGLRYVEKEAGTGATAQPGDFVAVHYRGTLENGDEFDSSLKRNRPFMFPLGKGRVIKGWDEGIALMKEGGKMTLIIPPELGYGDRGAGKKIPGGATLIFEVNLVSVFKEPAKPEDGKIKLPATGKQTTPSGLTYYDEVEGKGEMPKNGQTVVVHYTGQLTNGDQFDSSWTRRQPFQFPIGQGRVIKGWDEGVATMKPGGRRILVIPAKLGYGDKGAGAKIPPNSTLVFRVDLMGSF